MSSLSIKSLKRLILALIILLGGWQSLVYFYHLPPYILPSPYTVALCIWQNKVLLLQQSAYTLVESLGGLLGAVICAFIGALILVYFPSFRLWLLPAVLISQALPTFALAPLLVLWLGYGLSVKLLTVMLMLFFPITSAFYDGLAHLPLGWFDLASTMGATRYTVLRYLILPGALPSLGTGLRIAAAGAPLAAIIGEWVGASQGLGFLILNANARLTIDLMFAALFCLIILALGLYFIINKGITCLLSNYYSV